MASLASHIYKNCAFTRMPAIGIEAIRAAVVACVRGVNKAFDEGVVTDSTQRSTRPQYTIDLERAGVRSRWKPEARFLDFQPTWTYGAGMSEFAPSSKDPEISLRRDATVVFQRSFTTARELRAILPELQLVSASEAATREAVAQAQRDQLLRACALDATVGVMVMGALVKRVLDAGVVADDDAIVQALANAVKDVERSDLRGYARVALDMARRVQAAGRGRRMDAAVEALARVVAVLQ